MPTPLSRPLLPLILLTVGMHLPAPAQEADLKADPQADALAIAEQLYNQARGQTDESDQKRANLQRAAGLFADYLRKYPGAKDRDKVLYLQATCREEIGESAEANVLLGQLANNFHGEYAAAAAYKLGIQAADRSIWNKATGYFRIVNRETRRPTLQQDALYRLARALLQQNQRHEAEGILTRLCGANGVQPGIQQASLLALAQLRTEQSKDAEAYALFTKLLGMKNLEKPVRAMATLQAARLASQLGRDAEAQALYDKISDAEDMAQYAAEAQLEAMVRMYKRKDYEGIFKKVSKNYHPLNDPEKEARRALIVGQAYLDQEMYQEAAAWFEMAERYQPNGAVGADAAYRRIVCAQQMQSDNLLSLAHKFLSTYTAPGSPTASLAICDWVRFTYADCIMAADAEEAARQFDVLRIEQLPKEIQADAEYKKAWCAAQGNSYDPIPTLNHFIATYKQDPRLPDAYALRGSVLAGQGKIGEALRDFDTVLQHYPNSQAALVCWQKAAHASKNDPQRMIRYYEGLLNCKRQGIKPAALAEAHYSIACVLYETQPEAAVPHFTEAGSIAPDIYGSRVETALVQCYFKMQDADRLKRALYSLRQTNPASYNALPPGILRWCGWMSFQKNDFAGADSLLTDAIAREPKEQYTAPDGSKQERPKVEPIVWKLLAHSLLKLGQYKRGLEAARNYLALEKQPYRRAEGMRDLARLQLESGMLSQARNTCEQAISLGVDGPVKSALLITLGDTYFAGGQYEEASRYYGRVANVVSDAELKPLATYKLAAALQYGGKSVESLQYTEAMKTEFPQWTPPADAQRLIRNASTHEGK